MTISKIASLSIDNAGNTVATMTVPAGVTTAHLGIIVLNTASSTAINPSIPNWTRIAADPSGQANSSFYVFKRLGGQVAGDTITATFSTSIAARMSAIWYDTTGADLAIIGTPGTRNAASTANLVIPGVTTTIANQDVIVIASERTTATGTVINSWSPSAPTQDHYSESTTTTAANAVSHYFGRFIKAAAGATGNYTATYSGASTNGAGMMLAVAQTKVTRVVPAPAGGTTDDQTTLATVFAAAQPGDTISFPAGAVYRHSDRLIFTGSADSDITIEGNGATLLATNPAKATLGFFSGANNAKISNLKHEVLGASTRINLANDVSPFVFNDVSGMVLTDLTSKGSAGLGFYFWKATGGSQTRLISDTTLADGIHFTNGSGGFTNTDSQVLNAGDDGFAHIGYLQDGAEAGRPQNITLVRPKVVDSRARAISYAGARDCTATDVNIDGSLAANIYIAVERGDFNTGQTDNCHVIGGRMVRAGTSYAAIPNGTNGQGLDQGAVLFLSSGSGATVTNCSVRNVKVGNMVMPPTYDVVRAIQYSGTFSGCYVTAMELYKNAAGTFVGGNIPSAISPATSVDKRTIDIPAYGQADPTVTTPPASTGGALVDTFTRTSSTSAGTADSGQVWNQNVGTWGTDGSTLGSVTASDGNWISIDAGVKDQDFQAKLVAGVVTNGYPAILANWEGGGTYYRAEISPNGQITVSRAINSSFTTLATSAVGAMANGKVIRIKPVIGSTSTVVTVYVDDVQVAQGTDNFSAAGRPAPTGTRVGFRHGAGANGVSIRWDDAYVNKTAAVTPAVASTVWQSEPGTTTMSLGWIVDKGSSARAVVSLASDLSNPIYSQASTVPTSKWVTARVTGLVPDTRYYVGLEVDGVMSTTGRGNWKTLTSNVRASKVITSSCNVTQSNHVVFDRIKTENPDLFIHQGDIHYADTNDETTWRSAFSSTISGARFSGMLSTIPMSYDWDNHDTGGNGSFKDGAWATFAPEAVRQLTGSAQYPTSRALYKTWVHAGVRYIETDRWLERDSQDATNSESKYMLSAAQEAWLLNILRTATEPAIVWLSGFPHYSNLVASGRWGSYPNQRIRIDNAIKALPAAQRFKIICVGGDSHSICADDGTNAMWNLPSLNASPLDKTGGLASGTWNIANLDVDDTRGYYSRLTFTPGVNQIAMTWDAMQDDGTVMATWSRNFPTTANSWSLWTGTTEVILNYQGVYDGSAIQQATVTITS